jgi:putative tryptophan/tyrosine transport system substrate-binding protein
MGARVVACAVLILALFAAAGADAQPTGRKARVGVILNAVPPSQLQPGALTSTYALAIQEEIVRAGWHPGRNLEILWRTAESDFSRFPAIIDELLRQRVDVFLVGHNELAHLVRKKAPTTPIVMHSGVELMRDGLVATLAKPGGNITGAEVIPSTELFMKQLSVLREGVPGMTRVAYLCCIGWKRKNEWGTVQNPPGKRNPVWETSPHRDVVVLRYEFENLDEIEAAVAHAARAKVHAVIVAGCAACFQADVQRRIHAALEKHRLPAISSWLDAVANGWMMGYGIEPDLQFRRAGYYVGRILNGARPAELPVERLDNFKLYVNRKTAKAIGLPFPDLLLLRADRVFD